MSRPVSYAMLAEEPLVLYTPLWHLVDDWAGEPKLTDFAPGLAGRSLTWVVMCGWYCATEHALARLQRIAELMAAACPQHRLIYAANTYGEYRAMRAIGLECIIANHNAFVNTDIFFPLARLGNREFSAVYNARFRPFKRHELLTGVKKLMLISYNYAEYADRIEYLRGLLGNFYFVNDHIPPVYRDRISPEDVNMCYNRACCGLALSAEEGAMYACTEYLLAGLPVVTTVNNGGRDHYLDGRFSRHVPAEPDAIAEAVETFVDQQISPSLICEETLRKIRADRYYFATTLGTMCGVEPGIIRDNISRTFYESKGSPCWTYNELQAVIAQFR